MIKRKLYMLMWAGLRWLQDAIVDEGNHNVN